jgi:RNA polymerase sigma factor FliA
LSELHKLLGEINALEIRSLQFVSPDSRRGEDISERLPSGEADPLLHYLRSEAKELLTQAMAELPEKERQVRSLYYFEELTMKKVGIALGVGESRISQLYSMAVVRLKARMAELTAARAQGKSRAAAGSR